MRQQLRINDANLRGLVVGTVDPNSDAGQKGIQPGDVILSIDNNAVATPEAAAAAIEGARRARRGTVLLLVKRGNGPPAYVGVELSRPAATPGAAGATDTILTGSESAGAGASRSRARIRPRGPEPRTRARSMPRSHAMRRASGVTRRRVVGAATGVATAGDGAATPSPASPPASPSSQ